MMHAEDLSLRGMSDEEMDELIADKELMAAINKAVYGVHRFKHSQG